MSDELEMAEVQQLTDETNALKKRAKDEDRELTESEQNRINRNTAKLKALHVGKPKAKRAEAKEK